MKSQRSTTDFHKSGSDPEDISESAEAYLRHTIQLFCEKKGIRVDHRGLAGDMNLYEAGLFDSFDLFAILTTIERDLNVELDISEREPDSFTTIDTLTQLIVESRVR